MHSISEHTMQMNIWISLCQIDPHFPGTLRREGYRVDIVDPKFIHHDEEVNPDLVLTNPDDDHVLVIDCKSWTLKDDQHEKYVLLLQDPRILVTQGVVRGVPPERIGADFAYSSFEDLSQKDDLPDAEFALVQFQAGGDLRIEVLPEWEFEDEDLQNCFPVNMAEGDQIPTGYFPFDPGHPDDEARMVLSVLQEVLHLAVDGSSIAVDDILEEAHPFWVDFDEDKKEEARARVETIMNEFSNQGLDEHLQKVQTSGRAEWKVIARSVQALQDRVDDFIEQAEGRLKQRSLEEFGGPGAGS